MKKPLFMFGFLCILCMVTAQTEGRGFLLAGEVIYRETQKMDIQLEGVDAQLAERLPTERTSQKILHFTEKETFYENYQKDEPGENMHMEESGVMIKMSEPDNLTYVDLENKKVIEQKEFMSRVFLIESDLEPVKWKLTGGQRKILEYACQEAITVKDGREVRAWFTPEIGVSAGPGVYNGLPGLVLAVETLQGDHTLEATGIEIKHLGEGVLMKPGKGKKVTREEYQAIVDEKLKEMGIEGDGTWHDDGGASTVVIQIKK